MTFTGFCIWTSLNFNAKKCLNDSYLYIYFYIVFILFYAVMCNAFYSILFWVVTLNATPSETKTQMIFIYIFISYLK